MSFAGAEDTHSDNYCYLISTSVDVRVKVWPVDKRGNKGEKIWEGIIKKGEKNDYKDFRNSEIQKRFSD